MKVSKIKLVKRDGSKIEFDEDKIFNAIKKASVNEKIHISRHKIKLVVERVVKFVKKLNKKTVEIEQIQDLVVSNLEKVNPTLSQKYQEYRLERSRIRESQLPITQTIKKIGVQTDRDNANVGNNFSAKLLRIASEANKWVLLNNIIPTKFSSAHKKGDIYIHDLDSYNLTINCLQVPTRKLLQNGFDTGYGYINPAKRIESAAALSCIILQSSQNDMFGGQSHPNFDNDMAPFVALTRKKLEKQLKADGVPATKLKAAVASELIKAVNQAMQACVYNLNSMHSRAGAQVPFSSINIGIPENDDAAMVCQSLLEQYCNGLGNGEQPIFPNIIFRVKEGVNREPNDKYYYLFKLACHVTSIRMNPTYMNIDADFNKEWYDKGVMPGTMGCRTYIMANINGEPGIEGRGNIAPVTINLPRIGILANKSVKKFYLLFDEIINLAKDQLLHRYDVLKKLRVSDLPFVAGQKLIKGSENLSNDDYIEPILKQGTWGIGFIGLAETLIALTGSHHGKSKESQKLGIEIITHLRKRIDEFKEQYKLNFSCYATPAEGLSNKFTIADKKKFGDIEWINTKGFYTNSFHVPVDFPISYVDKINIEAPYHKLCNAGHISYIEYDDTPTGEQVEKIIRYAYTNTNISYMGINFHIRYCLDCAERLKQLKSTYKN